MTEALTTQPQLSPPAQWLSVAQAQTILGYSDRHVRRLAGRDWAAQGLARVIDGDWQIRSDADSRLAAALHGPAAVPLPIQSSPAIPKPLLDVASNKLRILNAWANHIAALAVTRPALKKDAATDDFLETLALTEKAPARRTLYNWDRDRKQGGLAELVDGRSEVTARRDGNGMGGGDDPFFQYLKTLYLDKKGRKIAVCYDRACDKAGDVGWTMCSEATARRYLKSLNPAEVILYREGPKAFTNKCEPYIDCDYSQIASNEFWNADHHEFDVLVRTSDRIDYKTGECVPQFKRPWLTAWEDFRSRKIVGWIIRFEDPATDAVLAAFRNALLTHGKPSACKTDNGKDFVSRLFTGMSKAEHQALWKNRKFHVDFEPQKLGGIYAALNINHLRAWKFHGQSKPVERFFGTVCEHFSKEWDTYCGRSPLHKPEDLVAHLKAGRAPSLQEFIAVFEVWLAKGYHGKIHEGNSMDMRPDEAWETCFTKGPMQAIDEEEIETLLTPRIGPLTVTQNGLTHEGLQYAGRGELVHLLGQKVWIRLRTLGMASVWSDDDKTLIGVVPLKNKVSPLAGPEVIKAAIRERRADRKKIVASFQPRLRIHETTAQRIGRIAEDRRALPAPASPAQPVTVQTHLAGQMNDLHEAFEDQARIDRMRVPALAAGAENLDFDAVAAAYERSI